MREPETLDGADIRDRSLDPADLEDVPSYDRQDSGIARRRMPKMWSGERREAAEILRLEMCR